MSILCLFPVLAAAAEETKKRPDFPWVAVAIGALVLMLAHTLYKLYRRRAELDRGMQLESEGRLLEAAEIFKRAARKDKTDAISRFHLGLCRELMGDVDGAREAYESVAADPRCDFAARTRLLEMEQGHLLDTQKVIALDFFERGVGLLARGDLAAAQDSFNEGAAMHPAYRPVHYYLGLCAEINGRPNEALGHYERLLEDEKEQTLARHRILAVKARKLWNADDVKTAIKLRRAWNYLQIDLVESAVDELESLVHDRPDEYTAHFGLAICHILTGTPDAAREHYQRVPQDDVRYADAQEKMKEMEKKEEE